MQPLADLTLPEQGSTKILDASNELPYLFSLAFYFFLFSFSMKQSTSSHPPPDAPDATTHSAQNPRLSPTASATAAELSSLKIRLHDALRQFPDFPSPGILFEDILPIFADPNLHEALIRALELHVSSSYGENHKPDVVVGLEARGLLFGPSLALRLGAGFVPVRKQGKLPGPTETARFEKEYGEDFFQIQKDSIRQGQKVLIVDDIIATGTAPSSHLSQLLSGEARGARRYGVTSSVSLIHTPLGGSAAAAGSLVERLGGTLLGYIFILELDFLNGRDKLQAPVYTLLSSQEKSSSRPS